MGQKLRNVLLFLGLGIIIVGVLLWYIQAINWLILIVFIIAGVILIGIEMYNWGAGTDFNRKQLVPIENADHDWRKF